MGGREDRQAPRDWPVPATVPLPTWDGATLPPRGPHQRATPGSERAAEGTEWKWVWSASLQGHTALRSKDAPSQPCPLPLRPGPSSPPCSLGCLLLSRGSARVPLHPRLPILLGLPRNRASSPLLPPPAPRHEPLPGAVIVLSPPHPTLRTRPRPGHEGCGGELGRVALSTG